MRTTKREMKRKGFTLVELLIVIVVIGVLSAMMMLSSTEAVSSAKASNIVSNLRNMKTAALAWYADHLDTAEAFGDKDDLSKHKADILKYLNNVDTTKVDEVGSEYKDYKFVGKAEKTWFVYYDKPDATIGKKLAGRATSVGLYSEATSTLDSTKHYKDTDAGSKAVYMNIR